MKYHKTVMLKDGRLCVIRSAGKDDAREVYDCFNKTHRETDNLLTAPEENYHPLEEEEAYLSRKEASPVEVELCAVVEGRIVGTAENDALGTEGKIRHRAEFGISVERDYWGLGIGRALTESCIDCARQAGCRQLELGVVAENSSAIALYKSCGFEEFGRNPRGFCSRFSGWQELILMRLPLD